MIYADTSFFVSLYIEDRHSAAADELMRSNLLLYFTPLHMAEWTHAISQQVFRKQMPAQEMERVQRELDADRAARLWVAAAIPTNAFELCAELARSHGSKLGMRTLDSLHVACALELKAERFWTFDERQAKLARAEGLKT